MVIQDKLQMIIDVDLQQVMQTQSLLTSHPHPLGLRSIGQSRENHQEILIS